MVGDAKAHSLASLSSSPRGAHSHGDVKELSPSSPPPALAEVTPSPSPPPRASKLQFEDSSASLESSPPPKKKLAPELEATSSSRWWAPPPDSWRGLLLCAALLALYYAPIIAFTTSRLFSGLVDPKSAEEAGVTGFSEERAFAHVVKLSKDIGFRQEGTPGLLEGGKYLLDTVTQIQKRAGPRLRVQVDISDAYSGSFNLVFLQKSMTLGYRNLTNLVVRVSAADVDADFTPAVMVNGHYDSSIASQGAADCASCVATMLETLRQVVEGGVVPPAPMIFLFNGGEEIFLKAAHGFLTQHRWSATIGAFVNLEASGTQLPDLLVQSGAPWVQRVYARTVPHPMGSVICQDVFPHIPGDTDWRILAQDFDDIPGLDIMYTLNGYAYHTLLDSPENLQKGALQVRGDNLLPLLLGLASAPELSTRAQRRLLALPLPEEQPYASSNSSSSGAEGTEAATGAVARSSSKNSKPEEMVFFDVYYEFMVDYSLRAATAFVVGLVGLVALSPALASEGSSGCKGPLARAGQIAIGFLCYVASWLLAILLPVALAALRVWASGAPMTWYPKPELAWAAYFPMGLLGVLLPHTLRSRLLSSDLESNKEQSPAAVVQVEWSSHWGGVVLFNALMCLAICAAGLGAGYIFFLWALFLTPSLFLFRRLQSVFGRESPMCLLAYLIPGVLMSIYSIGIFQFVAQFMAEKMGASGTHPLPFGLFLPDIVLAVVLGLGAALIAAPFASVLSKWLCRGTVLRVLLYASLIASMRLCSTFPYSHHAPKRVMICRAYQTQGADTMVAAQTVMATADANDVRFMFKHAPAFGEAFLRTSPEYQEGASSVVGPTGLPLGTVEPLHGSLLAYYPINEMLDRPTAVPARKWQGSEKGVAFPELIVTSEEKLEGEGGERRRIHVEVHSGSLTQVWCTMLNITGPLVGWSLADQKLPAPERPERGGPPGYMLHLGGGSGQTHWQFWLEARGTERLTIEMAFLDHHNEADLLQVAAKAPFWVALYPVTSYSSLYHI